MDRSREIKELFACSFIALTSRIRLASVLKEKLQEPVAGKSKMWDRRDEVCGERIFPGVVALHQVQLC